MEDPDISRLAGMTVNERLFELGLTDQWQEAVRRRDRDAMIDIMIRIEVKNPAWSVDTVLARPVA